MLKPDFENEFVKLYKGDCLKILDYIPKNFIRLVLTDPPYGTIKGLKLKEWKEETTKWDDTLPSEFIFSKLSQIMIEKGKCVLFSQQPYTTELISCKDNNLTYLYNAYYVKNEFANFLTAKKAMVSRCEDICIFEKKYDYEGVNPLRNYFRNILEYIGANSSKDVNRTLGHRKAEHCFYVTQGNADHSTRYSSSQFSLPTEKVYDELIEKFGIDKMDGFRTYDELKSESRNYEPVFNLWQGGKSKSNILSYNKDKEHYHPTQKPVALLEDLIKTYTNEGDTVLDFTMGSGSTGVACINTKRKFVGIEMDDKYFDISIKRITDAIKLRKMSFF